MNRATTPATPLDLPEAILAWRRGRGDRIVRRGVAGSITLTMLLPGETLEATFPSTTEAARAIESASADWRSVSRESSRVGFGAKQRRGS